jgi:hypothetical protein
MRHHLILQILMGITVRVVGLDMDIILVGPVVMVEAFRVVLDHLLAGNNQVLMNI